MNTQPDRKADLLQCTEPLQKNISTEQDESAGEARLAETQNLVTRMYGDRQEETNISSTIKGHGGSTLAGSHMMTLRPRTLTTASDGEAPSEVSVSTDFQLLNLLGEGGMGVVYLARQNSMGRQIAVKMLKPDLGKSEDQKSKFLTEAVITGNLDHPNIIPIHDLGQGTDGTLFYAMKRVRGTPWSDVFAEKTLAENLEIFMRCADAIAFAHSRHVVHRDIKPENVMIGDFGEVMVMDWGLAFNVDAEGRPSRVRPEDLTGGSPAYMSPEMAAGPAEQISFCSDIYLLGATLYELITRRPPHTGHNVMNCLFNAGMNQIVPTDKKGELVDIALKAMATKPEDRYQSVREMQEAIRVYQSHSESVLLAAQAREHLAKAEQTHSYDEYHKALYGFEQAYELWDGNTQAKAGLSDAQFGLATQALKNEDFDLAAKTLSADDPAHAELLQQVRKALARSRARRARVRQLMVAAALLAITLIIVLSGAFVWIQQEKQIAEDALDQAVVARNQAVEAKQTAEAARQEALTAWEKEERARKQEEQARQEAEEARQTAETARRKAELAAQRERAAKELEAQARKQEEAAKERAIRSSYVANIGLAAAKIRENNFQVARDLLDPQTSPPNLRGWEWNRLEYLCQLPKARWDGHALRLEEVDIAPDGTWAVTGSWDQSLRVWSFPDGELLKVIDRNLPIRAVDISPDGSRIVAGDEQGRLSIWDAQTYELAATLAPTSPQTILSVQFSPDGNRVLSTSKDFRARVWDLESEQLLAVLLGEKDELWCGRFSPDGKRVVTGNDTGQICIWELDFRNVEEFPVQLAAEDAVRCQPKGEAVYAVCFSPDGSQVLSGGNDQQIHIWNLQGKPQDQLSGHSSSIQDLRFSADGTKFLSTSNDNTVRIWDWQTKQTQKVLRGASASVTSAAFSPSGEYVLGGSEEHSAFVWKLDAYHEQYVLHKHDDAILASDLSEDGQILATVGLDQTAKLWNPKTRELLASLLPGRHQAMVSATAVSEQADVLATADGKGSIYLWSLNNGALLHQFKAHTKLIRGLAFSPDGKYLLSGGEDALAYLWDVETAAKVHTYKQHRKGIWAVAFAPDGQRVFTADSAGKGMLWALRGQRAEQNYQHHSQAITAAAFIPNTKLIATASYDQVVSLANTETGREVSTLRHNSEVTCLAVTADGKQVLTGDAKGGVRYWDLSQPQQPKYQWNDHKAVVYQASVSPDGQEAYTVDVNGTVCRWDLAAGKLAKSIPREEGEPITLGMYYGPQGKHLLIRRDFDVIWKDREEDRALLGVGGRVALGAVAISPDGTQLATGGFDGQIYLWDLQKQQLLRRFAAHEGQVFGLAFTKDGQRLLTAGHDQKLHLWEGNRMVRTYTGKNGHVNSVAFSADGSQILAAASDGHTVLFDVEQGEIVQEFIDKQWAVLSASFGPEGKYILTGSSDNVARVWRIEDGKLMHTLRGHTAPVEAAIFFQNRVATASEDGTIKIWNPTTEEELLALEGHTDPVTSLHFLESQNALLSTSRDQRVIIWPAVQDGKEPSE